MTPIERATRSAIEQRGWRPGSTLENRAALALSQFGFKPAEVAQQHRVGRYRLDFAWLGPKIALEVDGWHHLNPDAAAKDARRDAELRAAGWIVLRVDDREGENGMKEQLVRVAQVVRSMN